MKHLDWEKIGEKRNHFIEDMNRNDLISKKQVNLCRVLNYIDHTLIAVSTVTVCVSTSVFPSIHCIPLGISSSAIDLKICVINARIQKYKSIINEKRKKHDKIVLLA